MIYICKYFVITNQQTNKQEKKIKNTNKQKKKGEEKVKTKKRTSDWR